VYGYYAHLCYAIIPYKGWFSCNLRGRFSRVGRWISQKLSPGLCFTSFTQ